MKPIRRQVALKPALFCALFIASLAHAQEHDPAKLLDFSRTESVARKQRRAAAEALAARAGLPVQQLLLGGRRMELQRVEDGHLVYYITHNFNAARTISADDVWPSGSAGLGLTGLGQTLGIWDGGGVKLTHQEFNNGGVPRVVQRDVPAGIIDHATHVAGTLVAGGVTPEAIGMAFQANLDAYDWNDDASEMASAAAGGLRVSNHSYGIVSGWTIIFDGFQFAWLWNGNTALSQTEDYKFGFYGIEAQSVDQIVQNAPRYLVTWAAGNDRGEGPAAQPFLHYVWSAAQGGYVWSSTVRGLDGGAAGFDSLSGAAVAKNALTVGAIDDIPNGYSSSSDVVMSSFSGWGPTDDGRIKPDLVANGIDVYSSVSAADTAYAGFSGTSMATPNTAGAIALLQEHYANLFGQVQPLASTIKALLIHTANEAGPSPGPDYQFGWGLVNVVGAAQLITLDAQMWGGFNMRELTLLQGKTDEFEVNCNGSEPLRVTITWTDPPGTVGAAALDPAALRLKHNLNLRVIAPGGTTYFPWVLNPATPSAAATTGDNTRDNVEQVYLANPGGGRYKVRITHTGTLTGGKQVYSAVVSGATPPVQVNWANAYNGPANGADRVWGMAPDSSGNVFVTGKSDGPTSDYVLIKYNAIGEIAWSAVRPGPGINDYRDALVVDAAGNCYVTGTKVIPGAGSDFHTVKYGPTGNLVWETQYSSSPSSGSDIASDIAVDSSGNVLVTGAGHAENSAVFTTVKYNASGVQQWVKTYATPYFGGDYPARIAVDANGAAVVTGQAIAADGAYDIVTIRYNSAGTQSWLKRYHNGDFDIPYDLVLDNAGNAYVTGISDGNGTAADITTIKYSTAGSQAWLKRFDGGNSCGDFSVGIAIDGSGNVIVGGQSCGPNNSTGYILLKYTSSGTPSLTNRYFAPGASTYVPTDLAVDAAGNAYLSGELVVKFNSGGVLQWVLPVSGYPVQIREKNGAVYAAGFTWYYGTHDFFTIKINSTPLLPPLPPSSPAATPGSGQITLTWTASIEALTYKIKRSTAAGGPYQVVATVETTSYVDTGLESGTRYYYAIVANNAAGDSGNSAEVNAIPLVPTITVATAFQAGEPGTVGRFTVTRNGGTGSALMVNCLVTGTATPGADYTAIASPVTIPVGSSFANVDVTAMNDYEVEPTETVILMVLPNPAVYSVGSPSSDTVGIADNDILPSGWLGPRLDFASGSGPIQSVIADLDGDGKKDVAVANAFESTISVFRNTSSGSLDQSALTYATTLVAGAYPDAYSAFMMVAGDMDGDGKLDLITANHAANTVSVIRNNSTPGSFSFGSKVDLAVGNTPVGVGVLDLDGDGRLEIVTANWVGNTASVLRNSSSPGTVSFAPKVDFNTGSQPHTVALGDLDGDGKPEMVIGNNGNHTVSVFRNQSSIGVISAGSFASAVVLSAGGKTVAIGDWDGDSKPDLITGSWPENNISLVRNTSAIGNITFDPALEISTGAFTHTVAVGDLDGDGKLDLTVVTEMDSFLLVYRNQSTPGSMALSLPAQFETGSNAVGVSLGDLDGDGRLDVVFANVYSGFISVYKNLNAP